MSDVTMEDLEASKTIPHPMEIDQDLYTADAGGQSSSTPGAMFHNGMMGQTQPEALHPQMMGSHQLFHDQGQFVDVITDQPRTIGANIPEKGHDKISPAQIKTFNPQDSIARDDRSQDAGHSQDHMKHQNNPTGQIDQSGPNTDLPQHSAGGSSLDEQKQKIQTNKSHPEKDKFEHCNESTTQSQPPEPKDTATFKIRVISSTPFDKKWKSKLEGTLQSWFAKRENQGEKQRERQEEKKVSVLSLTLMDNGTCAQVAITPSAGLETLKKHEPVSLNFKLDNKEVTVQICLDKTHPVTVSQLTSEPDKNRNPPSEVNSIQHVTLNDTNNGGDAAASHKDPSDTETSPGIIVPLRHYWYILHVYKKELELIQKQHGVSLEAELSVSFKPMKNSSSDSVSKASEDFQKLLSECVDSCSYADINHNDLDSDFVKETFRNIQSEKTKLMFTMSASDCQFFGPKKLADMIRRETTRAENQFKSKSNEMDVDGNFSQQRRSSLHMDMKDLQTQLEMGKVYWDLMKLSYKDQLSQLETKYGVIFHVDNQQKNVIKVQARSEGDQHVNLESYALRALTNLYQKLASAAVSCELTKLTNKTEVSTIVEELQQQHCVVKADVFSSWKLVGLPEHLGPAIVDIEKKLKKQVFDDKTKKLIGYLRDIPHARGIRWNQMFDHDPGAVAGAGRNERLDFREQDETGFSKKSEDNSRQDSKGTQAEEEMCVICMDSFTDKTKLKCGHEFCQVCINSSVESLGPICPVCKEVFGKLEGNQPEGTMHVTKSRMSLLGYQHCGTIEIQYHIPGGIQTNKHPNPGQHFHGASRRAYLPDNREGNEVLSLLQRAFNQRLIFTVGTSTTSGIQNAVTWNDIHHKTNTHGGPLNYGYPDPDYLKRVKDELKAKGIE